MRGFYGFQGLYGSFIKKKQDLIKENLTIFWVVYCATILNQAVIGPYKEKLMYAFFNKRI